LFSGSARDNSFPEGQLDGRPACKSSVAETRIKDICLSAARRDEIAVKNSEIAS
jgi:hypothetical protein